MEKTVVDLFCGSGGASCGFKKAKFTPICGVDLDKDALKSYSQNFPSAECIHGDIRSKELQHKLIKNYSHVSCIIMCPPCQSFSNRNLTTPNKEHDIKNELPLISAELVSKMQPRAIFMEEVAQCKHIAPQIKEILNRAGYKVQYSVVTASNYQVPQKRKRFILIATLPGTEFVTPLYKRPVSVSEALAKHPIPLHGPEVSIPTRNKIIELQKEKRRLIGGNYALIDMSKPAPTIHTQSLSSTGPYTIKRPDKENKDEYQYYSLSISEVARLQSYPSTFKFIGNDTSVRRQLGNSVPPMLAKNMAINIKYN